MTLTTHVTEQTQYKMAAILKFKMAAKIMNETKCINDAIALQIAMLVQVFGMNGSCAQLSVANLSA